MHELCAKDGGVKVYEMVKLPPEKFNQYGQINFFKPTQGENALGAEYIYKCEIHTYRKGEPAINPEEISMERNHVQIIRRVDMRILGGGYFVLQSGR